MNARTLTAGALVLLVAGLATATAVSNPWDRERMMGDHQGDHADDDHDCGDHDRREPHDSAHDRGRHDHGEHDGHHSSSGQHCGEHP